jgi:hypothetical protein
MLSLLAPSAYRYVVQDVYRKSSGSQAQTRKRTAHVVGEQRVLSPCFIFSPVEGHCWAPFVLCWIFFNLFNERSSIDGRPRFRTKD